MAFTDTQALVALLKLDDKFSGPLKSANKTLGQFDANLTKTGNRGFKAGQQIGTGIKNGVKIAAIGIGFLATNVAIGLRSLIGLEKVTTQTNAVLASTKGISGQTADSIRKMAEHFEDLNATMDDTVIQSGANVLLTFTNIRRDAFEPTLLAALNLSTVMKQDLQTSVVQVGKAMQDPVKGMTALKRIGVGFTTQQIDQVKALVGTGDAFKDLKLAHVDLTKEQKKLIGTLGPGTTGLDAAAAAGIKLTASQKGLLTSIADGSGLMQAQKIILAELDKEFGGSFLAGGTTTEGKVAGFTDAIEELQRILAKGMLPVIGKVTDRLKTFLADPQLAGNVEQLGMKIAGLFSDENLNEGANVLRSLFHVAGEVAPAIQSAAEVTGKVVAEAVNMFKSLPPELQAVLVGGLAVNKLTGGLVTNLAGGAVDAVGSVLGQFLGRGSSPANPLYVSTGLPGGGLGPGGGLVPALIPIFGAAIAAALTARAITDQANTDFSNAGIKTNFQAPGSGILPFGIDSSIGNILEFIRIAQGGKPNGPIGPSVPPIPGSFGPKGIMGPNGPIGGLSDAAIDLQESASHLRNATVGLDQMATAFKPPSRAQAMGEYSASNRLLGVTGPTSVATDTSLKRRFGFLAASHAGSKDVTVANALATHFERTQSPLYRSNSNLKRAIDLFKRDQRQLLLRGDTKNAGLIGKDIARLKAELARRLAALKAAADKDRKIVVNNNITNSVALNGRVFSAVLNRYVNIYSNSGQFGGTGPR